MLEMIGRRVVWDGGKEVRFGMMDFWVSFIAGLLG